MKYIKATEKDIDAVCELVQDTIKTIYPKYYPAEVVDFFCEHHCKENITKDIADANKEPKPENHIYFDIGDITKLNCECIVNAANRSLLGGGGVDGAIHRAAGKELLEECRKLHGCKTGEAKITKGYHLKADYVIHTVGPIYSGCEQDETDLESCYRNSLELAKKYGIHSIAFPAISTGVYGYPLEEAIPIAIFTVTNWFNENRDYGMEVIYSCFDQKTYDSYQEFIALVKEGGNR